MISGISGLTAVPTISRSKGSVRETLRASFTSNDNDGLRRLSLKKDPVGILSEPGFLIQDVINEAVSVRNCAWRDSGSGVQGAFRGALNRFADFPNRFIHIDRPPPRRRPA